MIRVIDFLRFSLDLVSPPVDLRFADDFLVDFGVPLDSGAAGPSLGFFASADSVDVLGFSAAASDDSFLSSGAVVLSV